MNYILRGNCGWQVARTDSTLTQKQLWMKHNKGSRWSQQDSINLCILRRITLWSRALNRNSRLNQTEGFTAKSTHGLKKPLYTSIWGRNLSSRTWSCTIRESINTLIMKITKDVRLICAQLFLTLVTLTLTTKSCTLAYSLKVAALSKSCTHSKMNYLLSRTEAVDKLRKKLKPK